jgi:hypothetical protein
VTGADDTLIDGDIPYVVQVAIDTVNTLDANFASLPAQDVNAINADDDVAGFHAEIRPRYLPPKPVAADTFTVCLGRTTEQRCRLHHLQQRHHRGHA